MLDEREELGAARCLLLLLLAKRGVAAVVGEESPQKKFGCNFFSLTSGRSVWGMRLQFAIDPPLPWRILRFGSALPFFLQIFVDAYTR